ncbi:hypothetical protein WDV93_26020 [Pantoea ananatis]
MGATITQAVTRFSIDCPGRCRAFRTSYGFDLTSTVNSLALRIEMTRAV